MDAAEFERWKTVQLMGIVDKLYCERFVLVQRIVHYEAWAARTGRVTAVLTKERARLNEVDFRISSAQHQLKWRQEVIHPLRPQQQRAASARREPALVDPLAARGTSNAGEQRQQQQPEQQQPQQLQLAALRREMVMTKRELAIAKLRAATSEAQRADLERTAAGQRRTTVGTTVRRQGQEAHAGTLTTAVNHTRSAPTPKFDEEATKGNKEKYMGDEEREEEQAEELISGEQTSRSGSSAQDGQEALPQPLVIEKVPIEPACWVSAGAQEQVASSARHVETHPAMAKEIPSHANEKEVGEMVLCTVGMGEEQEHQPLPPPLPPPPPLPTPPPPPAEGTRADLEAEQHALVVASRLVLAHGALVSYEKRKEEEEEQEEEEQQQEQHQQEQQQQQQQGSKEGRGGGKQHHLQQGCVWTSIEAGPRWRLGGGLMPPFSPD